MNIKEATKILVEYEQKIVDLEKENRELKQDIGLAMTLVQTSTKCYRVLQKAVERK